MIAWLAAGTLGLVLDPGALLGALVLVLLCPPLRRRLVTGPLMRLAAGAMPRLSDTERSALEAGSVWFDGELFSGRPDWRALADFEVPGLTPAEQEFLDGPTRELCGLVDEWRDGRAGGLAPEAWERIWKGGFAALTVPRRYGGREVSRACLSAVVTRLASRSLAAAIPVLIPNSVGPAELLERLGTPEQKAHWLPRLAAGDDVPCFSLTEPEAGSDATSLTSTGTVGRGRWQGEEVVGVRLDWEKRTITLAPRATLIGLAFRLRDPDGLLGGEVERGITVALVPADLPGIEIGRRHDPLGLPFDNGPHRGVGVFVPLDMIVGGAAGVGQGWRTLVEGLAAGRGVTLPSVSAASLQLMVRSVGAYATLRRQFGRPIGDFEGVREPLARLCGWNYMIGAGRRLTLGALDRGHRPAVLAAIMKTWSTEAARAGAADAMDVLGGAGICLGPRNLVARAHLASPIGVTVEGANILTRSLIVFGQGAMRAHPFLLREVQALEAGDVAAFDRALGAHLGHLAGNAAWALLGGLGLGKGPRVGPGGVARRWLRDLDRLTVAFAVLADACLLLLGGRLKARQALAGRLADALANLYLGAATWKHFADRGALDEDLPAADWAARHAAHRAQEALLGVLRNLRPRPVAWLLRALLFPLGRRVAPPSDAQGQAAAASILGAGQARTAHTPDVFVPPADQPGLGQLEAALAQVLAAAPLAARRRRGEALSPEDEATWAAAEGARLEALRVDDFEPR